jgi:hypothetical protein
MTPHIYKVVCYMRWDEGERYADCFWCVPWPLLSNGEFEDEIKVREMTHILEHGECSYREDGGTIQDDVLTDMGFPEAAKMLRELPFASLRAKFNRMERFVIDSEVPLTREQAEAHLNSRRMK